MKIIFAAIMCGLLLQAQGQNILVNPSFEIYNPCPSGTSQINNATGWTATSYSPDYYNACAAQVTQVSVPKNVCGYQYAASGNGYMGILCYGSFANTLIPDLREYGTGTLTSPLVVGNHYKVTINVVLMNAASHAVDHIGALFTVGLNATQPITNFAHVYSNTIISDTLNWTTITGTFIADSAYTHVVIGNLFSDANTNVTNLQPVTFGWNGYYFVDGIEVKLASTQFVNTCFGDSTLFTNFSNPNIIATSWNFGDPGSGAANLAYTLNAGHVFSAPGNYVVTTINIDNTGAGDTITTNVTIANPPVASLGNDTTICTGTTLNIGTSNTGVQYLWNTGDTTSYIVVDTAGVYVLTATDAGCSATDSIVINFVPCTMPVVNLAASDSIFCEKQAIDFFDMSLNNPTSWQWYFAGALPDTSTSQNPTGIYYASYGQFNVSLKACNAAGCDSVFFPLFITELQSPPTPVVTVNGSMMCSSPAVSYAWYETSNLSLVLSTSQCYQPLVPGNYFVFVFDSGGCSTPSALVAITAVQNHNNNACILTLSGSHLFMHGNCITENEWYVYIYDAQGKKIYATQLSSSGIDLPITDSGIYFYRMMAHGTASQGKFSFQK